MDQKLIDLYDQYTHGGMGRRDFLDRLAHLAGGGATAPGVLPLLADSQVLTPSSGDRDASTGDGRV